MSEAPVVVARNPDVVGENPLWDVDSRRLYWCDNRSERVYRLDPATGAVEVVVDGWRVYAFTLQRDGGMLLFLDGARVAETRPGGEPRVVLGGLPGEEGVRFNDVVVDRRGRVIGGVIPMEGGTGSLYSFANDGAPSLLATGLEMPNGMTFSANDRLLYVAETRGRRISVFDYDLAAGAASNRRTLVALPDSEAGHPDGLAVDAEGSLWLALSGGWAVVRYDASGARTGAECFAARKTTSIGFGGDGMRTAYVTSSSRRTTPDEELGPEGGALFAADLGVAGVPDHKSQVAFG